MTRITVEVGPLMWSVVQDVADEYDFTNSEAIRYLMKCGANWMEERTAWLIAPRGLTEEVDAQERP